MIRLLSVLFLLLLSGCGSVAPQATVQWDSGDITYRVTVQPDQTQPILTPIH